jgi:curved DNA-binding protein CbpA
MHCLDLQVLEAMDFYEVLGIAWKDATPKALKAARKARALAVHPDKVATPGADLAVSRVNAAFDTLSSAQARKEYEAWLARQS